MQAVNGTFFKVLFCCPNDRLIGEGARIYYKSCGLLFCLSPAYYIWIGGPKIEKTQDSSPKAKRRYQPSAPFFHWQNRLYGVSVSHRLIDVQPAFAATDVWTKATEIMQDVYTQILAISTIAAIVTASVALLLMNFSRSGKTVDESRAWLKRIVITWAILNSLGFIMSYIVPFFEGGQWAG